MAIRSVGHLGPSVHVAQALGTLLDKGRRASIRRAGLPTTSPCWQAAETRAATVVARADALVGTSADARVLLATLAATIAHDGLDGLASRLPPVQHPALTTVDTASVARWLRNLSHLLDGTDDPPLHEEAYRVARAVLDHPGTISDLLADAWLTVCGLALLEVASSAGSAQTCGSDAEVRLVQRAVATTLIRRDVVRASRIALFTGVDRVTLSDWLRFGPPSVDCIGHYVTSPTCAALTGVTAAQWRALNKRVNVPAARTVGSSLAWDEGQVLRWRREHGADDCRHQCPAHHHVVASIAAGAAGAAAIGGPPARGDTAACPTLRVVG